MNMEGERVIFFFHYLLGLSGLRARPAGQAVAQGWETEKHRTDDEDATAITILLFLSDERFRGFIRFGDGSIDKG